MKVHGDIRPDVPIATTLGDPVARFWSKVDRTAGGDGRCWLWIGARRGAGYGGLSVDGRMVAAHRYSWELANGEIPAGMEVCHTCDVPACVNPAHLWLGTRADNMRDRSVKLRGRDTKLTADQVRAIRADPRTSTAVAIEYGVHLATISAIRLRKNWAWLD